MKKRLSVIMVLVFLLLFRASAESPLCGSLIDPAGPEQPASAMWSLEGIFRWLSGDRAVTQRPGPFVEPSALPPASTGYTLNDLMNFIQHYPYPAPLPRTGQSYSYQTGDDGYWKAGLIWPPRFKDNGNGTVTDNLTGLIWLKKANCANAGRDWTTALSDVAQLNTNGTMNGNDCQDTSNGGTHQRDWRLPNVRELKSLMDYDTYNPVLTLGHPFVSSHTEQGYFGGFWSSTRYVYKTGIPGYDMEAACWVMDFYYGALEAYSLGATWDVWPVRGGP